MKKVFKKLKQNTKNNRGILIAFLLLIIPIIYSLLKGLDKNYWDAAMSSWLATILGVVVGIPIAFWINRRIQEVENKGKEIEAKKKNKEILTLINQELEFDLSLLKMRKPEPNALQKHPYQIDVWEAFSSSGEIKWISNITLLNRIASAYSIIKIEKSIEYQTFLATKGAYAFHGTEQAVSSLLGEARSFDKLLEESSRAAISEITKELSNH